MRIIHQVTAWKIRTEPSASIIALKIPASIGAAEKSTFRMRYGKRRNAAIKSTITIGSQLMWSLNLLKFNCNSSMMIEFKMRQAFAHRMVFN